MEEVVPDVNLYDDYFIEEYEIDKAPSFSSKYYGSDLMNVDADGPIATYKPDGTKM